MKELKNELESQTIVASVLRHELKVLPIQIKEEIESKKICF